MLLEQEMTVTAPQTEEFVETEPLFLKKWSTAVTSLGENSFETVLQNSTKSGNVLISYRSTQNIVLDELTKEEKKIIKVSENGIKITENGYSYFFLYDKLEPSLETWQLIKTDDSKETNNYLGGEVVFDKTVRTPKVVMEDGDDQEWTKVKDFLTLKVLFSLPVNYEEIFELVETWNRVSVISRTENEEAMAAQEAAKQDNLNTSPDAVLTKAVEQGILEARRTRINDIYERVTKPQSLSKRILRKVATPIRNWRENGRRRLKENPGYGRSYSDTQYYRRS